MFCHFFSDYRIPLLPDPIVSWTPISENNFNYLKISENFELSNDLKKRINFWKEINLSVVADY